MIKHTVSAMICLLATAVAWGAGPPSVTPSPITVTIIWDASADGGPHWPDYHSICRQCGSSLQPGDRLEIISAHAGKPKLRVSQILKTGDSQELESIYSLLKDIRCPLLFSAHVEKALAMATTRLDTARRADGDTPALVIVLTTGNLTSREIEAIRSTGRQLRERGGKLYVIGTAQSARDLLIAAHQGLFRWSALSDAAPSVWIDPLRPSAAEESYEPALLPQVHPVPDRPARAYEYRLPEGLGLRDEPITPASPGQPIAVEVTIKRLPDQPVDRAAPEPEQRTAVVQSEMAPPQPIEEPNTPVQEKRRASGRSWWSPAHPWLWLTIAAVAGLGALASFLIQDGRQAAGWRTKATAGLKDTAQEGGALIAKLNGQTHHLGRYAHVRTIHIGSGTHNTIRVCDRAVSDRHVRLYRKGSQLLVQNVGAKPITVNSLPLAPKARKLLVLPAALGLSETTTLQLSLVKPKPMVPAGRSEDHGQAQTL